ncbi:hypothetical protein [Glutamicibacter sp. TV12E]|uniref:hypothetical protein n=1 Tax=Glutamicibacter sp. TV12E TaxID=3446362 RepID=UPI0040344D3A
MGSPVLHEVCIRGSCETDIEYFYIVSLSTGYKASHLGDQFTQFSNMRRKHGALGHEPAGGLVKMLTMYFNMAMGPPEIAKLDEKVFDPSQINEALDYARAYRYRPCRT